ncbi:MAG: hypothetical protein BroJett018_35220 [Chloroflexota bacterium]|nr:hypothetical protein [Chloroflexota bacterium]GIK65728.1 MAG: hypothetical protein BroJett018_35220 [Chloroflexota bacterium]
MKKERTLFTIVLVALIYSFMPLKGDFALSQGNNLNVPVRGICWNANGTRLVVGREDGIVSIYDASGGWIRDINLNQHVSLPSVTESGRVGQVACHPTDSDTVYVSLQFRTPEAPITQFALNISNGQVSLGISGTILDRAAFFWRPNSNQIALLGFEVILVGETNDYLEIWDRNGNSLIIRRPLATYVSNVAWTPSGDRLLIFDETGITFYETANWTQVSHFSVEREISTQDPNYINRGMRLSHDGSKILITDYNYDLNQTRIEIRRLSDGYILSEYTLEGEVFGTDWNQDNERIALIVDSGTPNSKLKILNATNGTLTCPRIHPRTFISAAWDPNGNRIARDIMLWDGSRKLEIMDASQVGPCEPTTIALFNSTSLNANLLDTLQNQPPPTSYYTYALGVPISSENSQWVMGDWNGDGVETPGVYGTNGVFYHTNVLGPSSNWQGTWFGLLTGTAGNRPVAGRFDASVNHDCIGVTDSSDFPPYGTAFALYFTCDLAGGNPPKTFQWLSVLLPNSEGHSGVWEFSAGNFDPTVDAIDTIACRRGNYIVWTNTPPTTPNAAFPNAQYIGAPHSGTSLFVVGDWNSDGTDSFGLYYAALGRLRGRDDLDWNSGLYPVDQQLDTNVVGTTSISATTWRLR